MKTTRVFAMFLLALGCFPTAQARADGPDYQKVGSLAQELMGGARQVLQLAKSVPNNKRYSLEGRTLRSKPITVHRHAELIVGFVRRGDERRKDMLKYAFGIPAELEAMEDAARSLGDKADEDDDETTERVAGQIRSTVREMERAARRLKEELVG
jgi:hypothetical protein